MSEDATSAQEDALRRASLVLRLRSMGITDHALMSAFEATRRDIFVPEAFEADAYSDRLIPIACGQTMEAPTHCARLVRALALTPSMSVLEIGTGSGYVSALLARLSRRVISVERYRTLANAAKEKLDAQKLRNVDVVVADGRNGWPSAGPYHAILVTGSTEQVPVAWLEQLAPQGTLVAPIGPPSAAQQWLALRKQEDGGLSQETVTVGFTVPLERGIARSL